MTDEHLKKWRVSSYTGASGNCVEVAGGSQVRVRDTKDRRGPELCFSRETWENFVADLKDTSTM
jgi:hypothetical protein